MEWGSRGPETDPKILSEHGVWWRDSPLDFGKSGFGGFCALGPTLAGDLGYKNYRPREICGLPIRSTIKEEFGVEIMMKAPDKM